MAISGICKLCFSYGELRDGHIVSRFYFQNERLKGESRWRETKNPNVTVQDGEKDYLFCEPCEHVLGNYEKAFSERIYVPLLNNLITQEEAKQLLTNEFSIRFGVCQNWRVLVYYMTTPEFENATDKHSIYRTEKLWREFILEKRSLPSKFSPVFYFANVDDVKKIITNPSSHINVFTERGASFHVARLGGWLYTFSKINNLVITGNINRAKLSTRQLLGLINRLSDEIRQGEEKLTDLQKQKMIKRFSQDTNYKNSLSYKAMLKDLEEEKAAT